jgi:hypothetical protein
MKNTWMIKKISKQRPPRWMKMEINPKVKEVTTKKANAVNVAAAL